MQSPDAEEHWWSYEYSPQHGTTAHFIQEAMARLMPNDATLQVTTPLDMTCGVY